MRFEEAKQKCEKAGQGHLLAYFDELTGEEAKEILKAFIRFQNRSEQ